MIHLEQNPNLGFYVVGIKRFTVGPRQPITAKSQSL